ncbi:class I SAM-dependent methyltransferase [Candidatus Uhrbacteria bacterium]|nr:class I SAM-dependent methyltransferase [Candidatus Uhrbacteria bacterium]
MNKFLLTFALNLHSFSYKLASRLAISAEKGLHPKHRLMNYHQFFLDHVRSEDRVLDIGCGNGALAFDLAKKAQTVVGIDLNEKHRSIWKERYTRENLSYRVADATTIVPTDRYNVIVLSNVLEHIEARPPFLQSISHLAPLFLIRVPMLNRDWITLYKRERGLEYRLDTTHFTEYTLETFTQELHEAGFTIQSHSIQFGEIWAVVTPLTVSL